MSYELYWISGSPNAWRAALTLELKGLDYVSHRLDPSKGEHKTPEFISLNPRGKVPVLKDGAFVLYESIAIMAYVDRRTPALPLFGTTDQEHGRIWQRILEVVNYVRDDIENGVVRPLIRGHAIESGASIKAASIDVHASLKWLDGILSDNPYLAGDRLSAADVVHMPTIQGLIRAGGRTDAAEMGLGFDKLRDRYKAIDAWLSRIEALPAYDRAYPPHWRTV